MYPKRKINNRSIELPDGSRCVDFFQRPSGTFGFEEFRRDFECSHGWFPIGNYSSMQFDSEVAALNEAFTRIIWLKDVHDQISELNGRCSPTLDLD